MKVGREGGRERDTERERERGYDKIRERQTDRQTETERQRGYDKIRFYYRRIKILAQVGFSAKYDLKTKQNKKVLLSNTSQHTDRVK